MGRGVAGTKYQNVHVAVGFGHFRGIRAKSNAADIKAVAQMIGGSLLRNSDDFGITLRRDGNLAAENLDGKLRVILIVEIGDDAV